MIGTENVDQQIKTRDLPCWNDKQYRARNRSAAIRFHDRAVHVVACAVEFDSTCSRGSQSSGVLPLGGSEHAAIDQTLIAQPVNGALNLSCAVKRLSRMNTHPSARPARPDPRGSFPSSARSQNCGWFPIQTDSGWSRNCAPNSAFSASPTRSGIHRGKKPPRQSRASGHAASR